MINPAQQDGQETTVAKTRILRDLPIIARLYVPVHLKEIRENQEVIQDPMKTKETEADLKEATALQDNKAP